MGKLIQNVILVVMATFISLPALANGGDDEKKSKKMIPHVRIENKKLIKTTKTAIEDTLVYDKSIVDDTLTFDDNKAVEDTLVFADDEGMVGVKPKHNNNHKNESILMKTQKPIAIDPVIYPNPSYGQSLIEFNSADSTITEITVTSLEGALIKKENTNGKSYELTDMAAGNYIITIRNGNEVIQKRLFVK